MDTAQSPSIGDLFQTMDVFHRQFRDTDLRFTGDQHCQELLHRFYNESKSHSNNSDATQYHEMCRAVGGTYHGRVCARTRDVFVDDHSLSLALQQSLEYRDGCLARHPYYV
jgi:hypothetical protein